MKKVLVIAGPTGSGESTITGELLARFPEAFARLVTATTRAPRGGEQDGVQYYFFSKEEFLAKKESGEMLETTYIANRDTYYGTYEPDLKQKLDSGRIVIVNPDIVGTRYYKEHYDATTVFIVPASIDELGARLKKRDPGMTDAEFSSRIENAKAEMADEGPYYDYTVVNGDGKLTEAVDETVAILRKEGYSF